MPLDLDVLSDDQWLDLLQEVLQNGVTRDPLVRKMAQEVIITESEKLDVLKEAIEEAVGRAKALYREQMRTQIRDELTKDLSDPAVRLCTPEEEATIVVGATIDAKLELIDQAIQEMQGGVAGHLRFEVVGNRVTLQRGARLAEIRSQLDPQELRELGHLMYKVCNK